MVKVVILAAGRGKRMGKYTEECTKAMLPVPSNTSIGDIPLAAVTVTNCLKWGIQDFIFVVGYRKEDIIDYFATGYQDINIEYVEQNDIVGGTANAVGIVEKLVGDDDNFILIYGDVIPSEDDIFHLTSSAEKKESVMGLKIVQDPTRYGVVELDKGGNITKIVEKSENPPTNYANAGVYVLPSEIFKFIKQTKKSKRGEYELTDSIQQFLDDGGIMKHFAVNDLKDIGTKSDYMSFLEISQQI